MADPVSGFIDNQIIGFIEPRLNTANNRRFVDALLDSINRDQLAVRLADAEIAALHNQHTGFGASHDEPRVRPIMRRRFHVNAAEQYSDQHPDWSYGQCLYHAKTELTDDRIVAAIRQHAKYAGVSTVEGVSDWWEWLKANWSWTTFFSILSILLMFLSPQPSPHDGEMQ